MNRLQDLAGLAGWWLVDHVLFDPLLECVLEFVERGSRRAALTTTVRSPGRFCPRETSTLCTSLLTRERVADFSQLATSWDALLAQSRRPLLFTSLLWQSTWWEAFGADASLHILTLRDDGYDPEYQRQSVGLLFKALTVHEAIERGRRVFDFLQGAEPYKYDLGASDTFVHRLTVTKRAPA
ncbi:MAG TPA: GNAT family N-acetyltransferase [Chloroflexota bacterium]|nr:GNAT family N-acetyltransferase [Chloroflexota bacterium]